MSNFQNQTNNTRVHKIVETVALLQKSADSNKASSSEIWELMQPAIDEISELCGVEAERPETRSEDTVHNSVSSTVPSPNLKPPLWASIRQMAEEASLADLTVAMTVYLNRIDEELHK